MSTKFNQDDFFKKADDLMSCIDCFKKVEDDFIDYEGDCFLKGKCYAFKVTFCYNTQCCYCSTLFFLNGVCDFYNSFGCLTEEDLKELTPPFYNKLPKRGEYYQGNLFEDLYLFGG